MAALRSLTAFAALALFKSVHAWNIELPPCTSSFRPFVYAGCFKDPGNPDGLSYRSPLDTQSMTVEKCMAECKGNGYRYAGKSFKRQLFSEDVTDDVYDRPGILWRVVSWLTC